ncbi:MAG: hypothetical protein KIT14_18000 [bacterium]|nr:hypothetical protein [bacterium]
MPVLALARLDATSTVSARAVDRACLDLARATGDGVLAAIPGRGDAVALGRFHRRPAADVAGAALVRRTTGGRACAAGDGFLRLVLALPHRSALVAGDPGALAPEQILNRAVRGPMAALERLGVPVLYPGRDLLTVAGRPLAVLGLVVEDDGATLVDVVLSVARDAALLPHLLDRADPAGIVHADMVLPDAVTSLARLGRTAAPDDLLAAAARGYAERLGVTIGDAHDLAPSPDPGRDAGWETARRPDPRHTHHARVQTAVGVFEAHAALAADGTIADLCLAGDLLASTATVAALEQGLRGAVPPASAAVATALARPDRVLLGVPADTIAQAVAALRS